MTTLGKKNLVLAAASFLSILILGGCTSVKYSYDTGGGLAGVKTYAWAPSSVGYGDRDALLESNVQVMADQLLGQKGLAKVREKPDLSISVYYESEIGDYSEHDFRVRSLTLNMYNPERNQLVWRGTAYSRIGTINTDASFGDLNGVVKDILSHFPPR
jgi:hypothetical protein